MVLAIACSTSLVGAVKLRADDIQAATANTTEPISIAADSCTHWQEGVYDVWHLRGNCFVSQGQTAARGPEAVLWIDSRDAPDQPTKVIAYFEAGVGERVAVDFHHTAKPKAAKAGLAGEERTSTWFQRMQTTAPLRWKVPPAEPDPAVRPAIYQRGLSQFNPDRRRELLLAQYTEFGPPAGGDQALPPGMRRITIYQRSDSPDNIEMKKLATGENAAIVTGGIRVIIEGLSNQGLPSQIGPVGVVDISTDRAVIWAAGITQGAGNAGMQPHDAPLEIYMEGNIEFRQGDRIVYADRMFYDARRQIGVILNAELLTPLPPVDGYQYQGLVRLKAEALQQLDQSHFAATNALVTTSRLEEPNYDLSSDHIDFTDVQQGAIDPATGAPIVSPTGEPIGGPHQELAVSQGNVIHIHGVPVFYWPTIATDLTKPTFYLDNARFGHDQIFGTQVMADFDAYQVFGIADRPAGTHWNLKADYLSERGFGFGTNFKYKRPQVLGFVGPASGFLDAFAIDDHGNDNLGLGRRDIDPEKTFRYRLFGNHRQRLADGWEVTAESGLLSDRTFEEQYFEREWDELPSPRTGVRIKKIADNREWSLEANGQVNPFFTETQFLPRLDHYWLGQSLFGNNFTWFEHSQAAYVNQNIATTPTNPTLASQFVHLPWEVDSAGNPIEGNGERLITRQEIDLPLQLGAVKVVPFALGELARWGDALDGSPLDRAYVNTGVRASLPMWAVYPNVRDPLFNLNGLAHKVVFDAEFSYADANKNYDQLPLYDSLDDTSQIELRRRLESGALPPTITDIKFDPRTYALRSDLQSWVTSPVPEIADDLMLLKMGVHQRWQTKRGPAGNQHIVDWLTLDVNATWFPNPNRDNFGQQIGLLDYDMHWYLGDRFTVLSDGFADFFGSGLKTISAGVLLNRPTVGNAYLGLRSISGPINSNAVLSSFSYRLSEKWITTASTAVDLAATGNIGQTFSVTRIGESMLVSVGFNVDSSKNNVGVQFLVEPRFLPNLKLTRMTGIDVPPAGSLGLE